MRVFQVWCVGKGGAGGCVAGFRAVGVWCGVVVSPLWVWYSSRVVVMGLGHIFRVYIYVCVCICVF